jgi:anti-sigma regulatory factor (Ser/Thr protein kinase)
LLGQIDFGSHPRSWAQWAAFEAACNRVLEGYPMWNLCLYDVDHLPPDVLQAGRRSHPHLIGRAEGGYLSPEYLLDTLAAAHPTPFGDEPSLEVDGVGSAGQARAVLRRYLEKAGMSAMPAVEDLIGAVSELVTNALTHGQRPVTLRLWPTADYVHCAVADAGQGFDDPLAGYTKAPLLQPGQGLWLARQLSDELTFHRSDQSFTALVGVSTVRPIPGRYRRGG